MKPYFEFTIPHFAHFTIPAYALFAMIGLFCFMLLLYIRIQKIDMPFGRFLLFVLFIVIGVGTGSKLLFFMTQIPNVIADFSIENALHTFVTSGFVFYGGLFGAILGVFIFSAIFKIEFSILGNIATLGFPLFHMWGRIGCFFAGCCYGRTASWGIALQVEPGVLRIPIQLFESACLLCIFSFLLFLEKSGQGEKRLLSIYLFLYASCRFVLEIFRGDDIRGIWFGLSTSQWISLALILGILCYLAKNKAELRRNQNYPIDI